MRAWAAVVAALLATVSGMGTSDAQLKKSWHLIECKAQKCVDAQGRAHGRVVLRWPDGSKRKEGDYKDGKRDGVWTSYWPNGKKLAELTFVAGTLSGPAKFWYDNGKQRATGSFAKGSKTGLWSIWGTGGTMIMKTTVTGATISFPKDSSAETQAAAKAALPTEITSGDSTKLTDRAQAFAEAAAQLRKLGDQPAPAGLSKQDASEYQQHSAWLKSVADRFVLARATARLIAGKGVDAALDLDGLLETPFGSSLGGSSSFGASGAMTDAGAAMVDEMAAMNMAFLALTAAAEQESKKFQTLSNASKSRHDIALNAIRNMKA